MTKPPADRTISDASVAYADIAWRDGIPYSPEYGDVYYHRDDGYGESLQVFLRHNRLPQRWLEQPVFVIGEIGFGAGLRFLSTWHCWRRQQLSTKHRLHFISVERRPLRPEDLCRAHRLWPQLAKLSAELAAQYPLPLPGFHRLHFDDNVTLTLLWGEAAHLWEQVEGKVDAWFCDGFAPRQNPAAWSVRLFKAMAMHSKPGTTLATYSGSRAVSAQLNATGFVVERRPGFAGKKYLLCGRYFGAANNDISAADVNDNSRIAVIGAGLAGCGVAAALARRGLACTVFDAASQVAAEASGNPRALVNGQLSPAWSVNDEYYTNGALYTRRQLVAAPADVVWQADGMLYLAADKTRRQRLERLMSRRHFEPDCALWSNRKAVAERTGVDLACEGLWLPWVGAVDPAAWCRYLLQNAAVELRLDCATRTLRRGDDGWRVAFDGGGERFDVVIIAAACHSLDLLPSPWHLLPLKPRPGQISVVPVADGAPPFTALHDGGYLLPPVNGMCYVGATYRRDATHLALSTADDRENIEHWTGLHATLAQLLGQPPLPGRVGARAVTPDRLPLVGMLDDPTLLISAGHGSRGLASAPLAGELSVCRLTGEPLPVAGRVAAAVAPGRFAKCRPAQGA